MRNQRSKITVLLADDHRLMREGLRALLSLHNDIEVIGEAEDGVEALALAAELEPDVVVLDLSMPKMSGIEVLRQLSKWQKAPAVVLCSMHETVLPSTLALGANAIVAKREAAETLVEAVRKVAQNSSP